MNVWYTKFVAEPLGSIIEEIYVANRVGCKRVKYLTRLSLNQNGSHRSLKTHLAQARLSSVLMQDNKDRTNTLLNWIKVFWELTALWLMAVSAKNHVSSIKPLMALSSIILQKGHLLSLLIQCL